MWFKEPISHAFHNKRWGILSAYLVLAVILGIAWFIVSDRIADWANDQIDERMPGIMNWLFGILSSDGFHILAWVILVVLVVIGFIILYRRANQPTAHEKGYQEPLRLIDSFPKDNELITTEDVKKIFLKFNKPIDKETEGLIGNYYIKSNSWCQWNIGGWIQYAEENTKLIWHIKSVNKDQFAPMEVDYPTFEIRIPHSSKNLGLRATDGSRLPRTIIRVKMKLDTNAEVLDKKEPRPIRLKREHAEGADYCSGYVDIGNVRAGANLKVIAKVGDYTSASVTTNPEGYYLDLEIIPPNDSYIGRTIEFYVEDKKASQTRLYMGGGHSSNFCNLDVEG